MGIDFIQKKGGTIRKSWNHGARKLAAPDLFSSHPECTTRSMLANMAEGVSVAPKEQLLLQCVGDRLLVLRDMAQIACSDQPPADLLAAIRDTGGCAVAEAAKVYERSGTLELRIKE